MAKTTTPAAAGRSQGYNMSWAFGDTLSLIPALSFPRDYYQLRRMVEEDETVGAMLFCITSAIALVAWKHIPCVDGAESDGNPKAETAAAFADSLMIDMTGSWSDHLDDALTMVWAGFAPCEIITRQRTAAEGSRFNDGFYGIKQIPLRAQESISRWVYDQTYQELTGLSQMGYAGTASEVGPDPRGFIPMWKLALYRTTASLNRPQGRSLLGNAYRVWRLKKRIQDAEAIGIDRDMAGLPIGRVPSDVLDQAAETDDAGAPSDDAKIARKKIATMVQAVSTLRYDTNGGIILPSDPWAVEEDNGGNTPRWDFKIMTSAGQRSIDTRTAIRDYDRAIARVVMMQFLHLGDRAGGSYGLSDDQSSMAMRSLMFLVNKVAETWSRSVLPLVWGVNGMNAKYLPRLAPSDLTKEDLAKMAAYLTAFRKVVDVIETDPDARVAALRTAGIPVTRESQTKPVPKPTPAGAGDTSGDPPADTPPGA